LNLLTNTYFNVANITFLNQKLKMFN